MRTAILERNPPLRPPFRRGVTPNRVFKNHSLQDLELVCDIIAVMTLHAIGQEAWSLVAGIEKLLRFDRFHFGREMDYPDYPSPLLRRSVALALEKRISPVARASAVTVSASSFSPNHPSRSFGTTEGAAD